MNLDTRSCEFEISETVAQIFNSQFDNCRARKYQCYRVFIFACFTRLVDYLPHTIRESIRRPGF